MTIAGMVRAGTFRTSKAQRSQLAHTLEYLLATIAAVTAVWIGL